MITMTTTFDMKHRALCQPDKIRVCVGGEEAHGCSLILGAQELTLNVQRDGDLAFTLLIRALHSVNSSIFPRHILDLQHVFVWPVVAWVPLFNKTHTNIHTHADTHTHAKRWLIKYSLHAHQPHVLWPLVSKWHLILHYWLAWLDSHITPTIGGVGDTFCTTALKM